MKPENTELYEFGEFKLDVVGRSLSRGGIPIPLAPKVYDTLEILVRRHGSVISKKELMDAIWHDAFVEESNLSQNIYTLRKALENGAKGGQLIENVPRRGYRFNADVRVVSEMPDPFPNQQVGEPQMVAAFDRKTPERGAGKRHAVIAVSGILMIAIFVGVYFFTGRETLGPTPVRASAPHDPEAMQAYTRGMAILTRRGSDNRPENAIDEFQRAVTMEPTFALAYAGLAEGFAAAARREEFPASEEFYSKARAATQRALALDPNLPEAHIASGTLKRFDWDWAGAEADLRRAIQLNSKNAQAHQRLAQLMSMLSRHDEALSESKIAYDLDPIADYIVGARFPILEARREYEIALKEAEKFHLENKSNPQAARAYATFLFHKGDYPKVIELGERTLGAEQRRNRFAWHSLLSVAYSRSLQNDKGDEHLRALENIAAADSKARYSLAMNYAELGRIDEAVGLLESCYESREERMGWINVEPRFENLRTNGRFVELLRKMRLA